MLSKHSLKSATTIGLLACFMSGMVVTSALALLSVQASSRDSKQTTSPPRTISINMSTGIGWLKQN